MENWRSRRPLVFLFFFIPRHQEENPTRPLVFLVKGPKNGTMPCKSTASATGVGGSKGRLAARFIFVFGSVSAGFIF